MVTPTQKALLFCSIASFPLQVSSPLVNSAKNLFCFNILVSTAKLLQIYPPSLSNYTYELNLHLPQSNWVPIKSLLSLVKRFYLESKINEGIGVSYLWTMLSWCCVSVMTIVTCGGLFNSDASKPWEQDLVRATCTRDSHNLTILCWYYVHFLLLKVWLVFGTSQTVHMLIVLLSLLFIERVTLSVYSNLHAPAKT